MSTEKTRRCALPARLWKVGRDGRPSSCMMKDRIAVCTATTPPWDWEHTSFAHALDRGPRAACIGNFFMAMSNIMRWDCPCFVRPQLQMPCSAATGIAFIRTHPRTREKAHWPFVIPKAILMHNWNAKRRLWGLLLFHAHVITMRGRKRRKRMANAASSSSGLSRKVMH
jgi:hypothetical protein